MIAGLTDDRGLVTTVSMRGPMSVVGHGLVEQAEAVITEAVSNAVRHSEATGLVVDVTVADELTIKVTTDNGRGIPADIQRRSGLANMARRAE